MTEDQSTNRRPIPARNLGITKAMARGLAQAGITPNQISVFGLLVGVGSGLALALTPIFPDFAPILWIAAACMVGLRGLSNMLDGMVAVEHGKASATGLFFNEIPDRISDIALFVGAGYSIGGSPTAGWAAAVSALFVTYVRVIGTLAGAPADFGGPMAKQQRMFSVALLSLFLAVTPAAWHPQWGLMAALLWVLAAGGVYTAAIRLRRAAARVTRSTNSG
jgi:phosphatidylglycerophosphate synthase